MMVMRTTIPSSRIKHTDNGRDEAEMVIFGARCAEQNGTEDEWRERADMLAAEREAEQKDACAA